LRLRRRRTLFFAGIATAALAASTALAAPAGTSRGPNTPTDPYVLPVGDGVSTKSLLTVSDDGAASDDYEMVGIPDGLGAYKHPDSPDFVLLMNHELQPTAGAVRRHGQAGAFVSALEIDSDAYEVEEGRDLIDPDIRYWDYPTQTYKSTPSTGGVNPRDPTDTFVAQGAPFGRFCSSTLTRPRALWNPDTRRGYKGQIYFGNEEVGDEGRVFGVTTDGQAQQLPRLGLFSWENTEEADTDSDVTVTMGSEDTSSGQMWAYVGRKQRTGNPFDKAGLTNGNDFVVDLDDASVDTDAEFRAAYGKGTPVGFDLGADEEVDWDSSGARQNAEAVTDGLTLNRIEDGDFDPRNPDDFYFVTTEGAPGTVPSEPSVTRDGGGLWKLSFDDVSHPAQGGTLELVLDGSEAPFLNKPDNMAIDRNGNLLIQEDPGNNAQLARIIAYDIDTGDRGVLAEFDAELFRAGEDGFITQDEESSGIIDARRFLGNGWFLFDAQVHLTNPDPELVEFGQLLAMHVREFGEVYTIDGDT
jgi:Bacterial protein of unknown function (DUF839)